MKWDKAKFNLLKQLLNQKLPLVTDLGVVEVSDSATNDIDLGGGKICVIHTRSLVNSPEMLSHFPQVATYDWFSVDLYLDPTNGSGHLRDVYAGTISSPDKSIGFALEGKYDRLTPKHKRDVKAQTLSP